MGKLKSARTTEDGSTTEALQRKGRKGSTDAPSANALRERVRAQNMKRAYLNLQKTLPQVPPDTKLPRLNILLLAIDYISYLRRVLHSENFERSFDARKKSCMLKPFIEKWPIRTQLLSKFLQPNLNDSRRQQQVSFKRK